MLLLPGIRLGHRLVARYAFVAMHSTGPSTRQDPRVGEVSCCQCLTGRRLLVVIKDILVQNLLGAHDGVRLAEWFGETLAETEDEDEEANFWSDHVGLQGRLAKENLKGLMVRREIYIWGILVEILQIALLLVRRILTMKNKLTENLDAS